MAGEYARADTHAIAPKQACGESGKLRMMLPRCLKTGGNDDRTLDTLHWSGRRIRKR